MKIRRLWPYALLLLVIATIGWVFTQRIWITDWFTLRGYTPPTPIAALADDVAMTPYAERLFYVNRPALEDKAAFNEHCVDHAEQSAVLGCYHGDRLGIFVYDVTDERLYGVEQVTAAHEMLHQAYDRLDSSERQRIDGLLEAYYANDLTDQSVKDKIELYRKAGTADLANEMHSIFGTEIPTLPAELEAYYKQYFTDRSKVVTFSTKYHAEFAKLEAQVKEYDARLEALKPQIDGAKTDLDSRIATIRAKEREVQDDAARHDQAAYQADARSYNSMVDAYNRKVSATTALITEYNDIVAKRNAIAVQERQLQEALDSRLTPVAQ